MADTYETIADIIVWLRRPREDENADLTLLRNEIADRLDAANKRERGDSAKLREAVANLDKWLFVGVDGYIHGQPDKTGEIARTIKNALAAPATTEKSSAVGDSAKLREVVSDLLYMAERYVKKTPATESVIFDAKTKKEIRTVNYYDVIAKAQAALAAPPRNCDEFNTKDKAREAFQRLRGHRVLADVSLWDNRDEIEAFLDWLFALKEGGVK